MKSQVWTESREERRWYIGCCDAPVVGGEEERLSREKLGETRAEHPGKRCLHPPCGPASAERSASPVCEAHAEFLAVLIGRPPRTIPVDADGIDLEDRAEHLSQVFGALAVYMAVILDDTAQNVPGRLDLPDVEAHLADLAADVAGTIEHAAEDMAGWGA